MKLSQPWPEGFNINARSPYGWRKHPITGRRKFHHGVDVALPVGTELRAPADGVVVHKGNGPSGGVTLIIRHDNNIHTVFYHLEKPSHLLKGTRVERGEKVGFSGNTGASTGPHLHFEVRNSRRFGDTTDPMPFFEAEEIVEPVEPAPRPEPVTPKPRPEPVEPVERPTNKPKPKRHIPTPLSPKLQAFFNMRRNLK